MRLSIIIPVYNVERYIRACVESVFRQALVEHDYEVILVDDGTEDKSFEAIGDLVRQHPNIRVVRQPNQGLSAARNTGLGQAQGDYVLFLDSDDLLVAGSVGGLLQQAEAEQPDMLIAGFVKKSDEEILAQDDATQADAGGPPAFPDEADEASAPPSRYVVKSGREVFLQDFNPQQCYVWRTLYSRRFLTEHGLRFIPGIYFEDVPFTTECYLKAKKCVATSTVFYIYRQRPGSICSAISKRKVMDFHHVLARLWALRQSESLSAEEDRQLMNTLFTTFSIEVWYITHDKKLLAARREIMADLKQTVPQLRFSNGLKQRVVSLLYRTVPSLYIRLRALAG